MECLINKTRTFIYKSHFIAVIIFIGIESLSQEDHIKRLNNNERFIVSDHLQEDDILNLLSNNFFTVKNHWIEIDPFNTA